MTEVPAGGYANPAIAGSGAIALGLAASASVLGGVTVLARSEKWIIPRNPFVDILLALSIFGSETIFSWIPKGILRLFFDRDLYDLSLPRNSGKDILTETPTVNSAVLDMIRRQSQLAPGRHKRLRPPGNQPLLHAARTGRLQKRARQREAH